MNEPNHRDERDGAWRRRWADYSGPLILFVISVVVIAAIAWLRL